MMIPFVVQQAAANQAASAASLQSNSVGTTTTGNTILVAVEMEATGAGAFTCTITDTVGNTYTQVGSYVNVDANRRLGVFISSNITGGATFKVTATPSSSAKMALGAIELAGVYLASALAVDNAVTNTGTSTTPGGGSATVTNAYELVFSICTSAAAGNITCTVPTGYTLGPQILTGTTNPILSMAYKIDATPGTENPTWTIVSAAWAAMTVSLLSQNLPNIQLANTTGSDTLASGAGPATAKTGSLATTTAGSNSVSISATDAVDLSGVLKDGSAVICVQSTSGRKFSRIINISGSGTGPWTVTTQNTFANSETKAWAIGGKLKSLDGTNASVLLSADAKPGWTLTLTEAESLSAAVTVGVSGDRMNGPIVVTGATEGTAVVQTANAAHFTQSGALSDLTFQNLYCTCSNATNTSADGFLFNTAAVTRLKFVRIRMGSTTNAASTRINRAYVFSFTSTSTATWIDCEVAYCVAAGMTLRGLAYTLIGVWIHDCGSDAILMSTGFQNINLDRCLITRNSGMGLNFTASVTNGTDFYIVRSTFDANTGSAVDISGLNPANVTLMNNQFTNNGGYGVKTRAACVQSTLAEYVEDFNNFYNNTLGDGLANYTKGSNSTGVDPQYVATASNNYTPTNPSVIGTGFPLSSRVLGANQSGTAVSVVPGVGNIAGPIGRTILSRNSMSL